MIDFGTCLLWFLKGTGIAGVTNSTPLHLTLSTNRIQERTDALACNILFANQTIPYTSESDHVAVSSGPTLSR